MTIEKLKGDNEEKKRRWNASYTFRHSLVPHTRKSFRHTLINVFVTVIVFIIVIFWNQQWVWDSKEIIRQIMVGKVFLTGICLGLSGYLIQTLTNNRFSDTSILGIGNINLLGLMIFVQIIGFTTVTPMKFEFVVAIQPILYFISPLILMSLYFVASREPSRFNFKKMIIAGILVNFLSVSIALVVSKKFHILAQVLISNLAYGTVGVGSGNYLNTFYIAIVLLLIGLIIIGLLSNKIRIIVANQQIASQLGINVNAVSMGTLVAICLLVGASYSLNGNLVFLGLVAGNIARQLNRFNYKNGLITSSSIGSTFYLLSFAILFLLIGIPEKWVNLAVPLLISPYFILLISRKEN
ncbi:iron ABC transporter permease [Ureaplasma canigenitalium]|uniref:iron ABC transporter permease n=1 Tax=Ureaplasma canigenitalium TaxID=42092 RepID=UPI000691960A|nr:iron ABC transporter permease [Ureaplasma canigenitalium]